MHSCPWQMGADNTGCVAKQVGPVFPCDCLPRCGRNVLNLVLLHPVNLLWCHAMLPVLTESYAVPIVESYICCKLMYVLSLCATGLKLFHTVL